MADTNSLSPSCDQAFEALKNYDRGSGRAALLAIDEAVAAATRNEKARAAVEKRLIRALQSGGSDVAREYLCAKLALAGSAAAVPVLAALALDPKLSTAARNALQAIPGSAAPKALRRALASTSGALRLGIINSLAARRDKAAASLLGRFLVDNDRATSAAAAAALAEIGTVKAAKALREAFIQTPEVLRRPMADAMLVCGDRLTQQGRTQDAGALLNLLLTPGQPRYIQQAAERALAQASNLKSAILTKPKA